MNHRFWGLTGVATFGGHAQLLPWLTLSNNHTRYLKSLRLPRSHLFPLLCQCSSCKILGIAMTDVIDLMLHVYQVSHLLFSIANAQNDSPLDRMERMDKASLKNYHLLYNKSFVGKLFWVISTSVCMHSNRHTHTILRLNSFVLQGCLVHITKIKASPLYCH